MVLDFYAKVVYFVATRWKRNQIENYWGGTYKAAQQQAIRDAVEAVGGSVLSHKYKGGETKIFEAGEEYDGEPVWECYPKIVSTVDVPADTDIPALRQEISDKSEQNVADTLPTPMTLVRTYRKQYV